MTPAEAGALARDAGAGVLVLSHLWVEDDPFRAIKGGVADVWRTGASSPHPGCALNWEAN